MPVSVRKYRRKTIKDRFGHTVKVGEWPSQKGMKKLRRHYKREHPRAFRKSIEKGVRTRARRRREAKGSNL
jgi:hypothetical protein